LLKQNIRPEFLNRVDDIILFKPLTREDIRQIVVLQLKRAEGMLAKKNLKLEVSKEAMDFLGKVGYDPSFGARPLKRVIQKRIVDPLAQKILAGEFGEGDTIAVRIDRRGLLEFMKKTEKVGAS
jgi:ATP-dependent Clp protease ATP-binding subunit ClpB